MNRNEEYRALLAQLEDTPLPPALTDSVPRARARARRQSRRRRWETSLASLGGAAAAFALAVNLSAPFALACGKVPILKELAAAVATSPSMKAAIEHDYIQYVGQSQTENDVTVALEYLILDRSQLNLFFTVTGPDINESYSLNPILSTPDGASLEGCGYSGSGFTPGELGGSSITLDPDVSLPEKLLLTLRVTAMERTSDTAAIPLDTAAAHYDVEPKIIATLTFPLTLDLDRMGPERRVEIGQWVELDGQRLLIQSLDMEATQARLTVVSDPDNTHWCERFYFYLSDAKGRRYEQGAWSSNSGKWVSRGDDREEGQMVLYLESPYFDGVGPYTLSITGAEWLDKDEDKRLVRIDLNAGTAAGLPDGASLLECRRSDENGQQQLIFLVPDDSTRFSLFSYAYYDGAGERHYLSSSWRSHSWEETGYHSEGYYLDDYPYDTIALELSRTSSIRLGAPLEVNFE